MSSRPLRPRATSTIALAPATVTDRTAPLVLGLEPRVYRELVRAESIPHALVGRRLVCRVDDVLAALDLLAGATETTDEAEAPPPRRTGDRLLALIGRERAAAPAGVR
jgi:hypothetical protein